MAASTCRRRCAAVSWRASARERATGPVVSCGRFAIRPACYSQSKMVIKVEDTQRLLTVKEVAATLRLSPTTVYRLTRAGVVESVKFGGSVRIPARALDPNKEN